MWLSGPVHLPGESGIGADSYLERSSQSSRADQFLDAAGGAAQSIQSALEAEPGIEPEHRIGSFDLLDHLHPLIDGATHRLLTPHIESGPCRRHAHQGVPVRGGADVHHIDVGSVEHLSPVAVSCATSSGVLETIREALSIDIAQCKSCGSGTFLVGADMSSTAADTAATDDAVGDGVAGSDAPWSSENMSGDDVEETEGGATGDPPAQDLPPRDGFPWIRCLEMVIDGHANSSSSSSYSSSSS